MYLVLKKEINSNKYSLIIGSAREELEKEVEK